MIFHFSQVADRIPFILKGAVVTLEYTLLSLFIGLILGTFFALIKLSDVRALRWFSSFYTSIFRGTPLLVQLTLIYYATPQVLNYQITPFEAGVAAFSLNSAAYISEIIRAGIQGVDRGQFEAAASLAIPYRYTMLHIIFPQAIKNILPALVNETISLLKESAIVSVIAENDLLRRANIISSETFLFFEPLIIVAAIYYIMVMILTCFAQLLENRIKRSD
jgi:L-arginine ABC transporter membrane protein